MNYYSAIKKNEVLPFVTTWMDFKGIKLSEISQRQIPYDLSYMEHKKQKILSPKIENRLTFAGGGRRNG